MNKLGTCVVLITVALMTGCKQSQPQAVAHNEQPSVVSADRASREGGKTYVVQEGDSFWIIAQKMYGKGSRWSLIEKANPQVHPRTLKVGDKLVIPPLAEAGQ